MGADSDHTYRLEDAAVTVVLAGPLTSLDGLAVDELIVEIPVAGLDVGEHAVAPIVELPAGLSVARTVPEVVGVTVGLPS